MGLDKVDKPHSLTAAANRGTGSRGIHTSIKLREKLFEKDLYGSETWIRCQAFPLFTGDVNRPAIVELKKHFYILHSQLMFLKRSSTPCVVQAAKAFNQLLVLMLNSKPDKMISSVGNALIDIYQEIKTRTESPYQYQLIISDQKFEPLPKSILEIFPFNQADNWRRSVREFQSIANGNILGFSPVEVNEVETVSLKENDFIPELVFSYENIDKELQQFHKSSSPLITETRLNLQKLTAKSILDHVLGQRKVAGKTDPAFVRRAQAIISNAGNESLYELSDIILYHSVYTVILDRSGNPHPYFNMVCPHAECPILYPTHDFPLSLKRTMPPAAASGDPVLTFISMGKQADWGFMIQGKTVKQTFHQMVGAFYFSEYLQTGKHPYQTYIQKWLSENHSRVLAAVSSPSAFNRKEMSFSGFRNMVPVLLAQSLPYVVEEIIKQVKDADIKEYIKQTARSEIQELLKETILRKVSNYLIKTVGKKIVPLVNLAYAVKDIIEGEDERRQMRTMVACFRMAVQGGTEDDMTISSKVLSKVIVEKFRESIQGQLRKGAMKMAQKLRNSDKSPGTPNQDAAQDKLVPDPAPQPVAVADPPLHKPVAPPVKAGEQTAVQTEMQAAQNVMTKQKAADPKATGAKATDAAPTTVASKPDLQQAVQGDPATFPKKRSGGKPVSPSVIRRRPGEEGHGEVKKIDEIEDMDTDDSAIDQVRKDQESKFAGNRIDTKGDEEPVRENATLRHPEDEETTKSKQEEDPDEPDGKKKRSAQNRPKDKPISEDQPYINENEYEQSKAQKMHRSVDAKPQYRLDQENWDDQATTSKGIHSRGKYNDQPFHHLIPAEMAKYPHVVKVLKDAGITNLHILTVRISEEDHAAIHKAGYNKEWKEFLEKKPPPDLKKIRDFAEEMRIKHHIQEFKIETHPNPGKRGNLDGDNDPDDITDKDNDEDNDDE